MRRPLVLVVGVFGAGALLMFVFVSTVGTVYHHPKAPDERFVVRNGAVIHLAPRTAALDKAPATPAAPAPRPRIHAPTTVHDFGVMNPLTTGEYAFTIRNEGDGDLRLQTTETTCKCTVGSLGKRVLPPGQETTLLIRWNTGKTETEYSHGALLRCNDPDRDYLWFRVEGRVLRRLVAAPPELALGRVAPASSVETSTLIFSDLWDDFELRDIESSLPGLTWEVKPASAQDRERLQFKSGRQLIVRTPEKMAGGAFQHWLRLKVAAPQGESEQLQFIVSGKVVKRLCVYGKQVDPSGVVDLGRVGRDGATVSLVLRVHDPEPDLSAASMHLEPDIIRAKLTRLRNDQPNVGLYKLTLEVAPRSPAGNHDRRVAGVLRLTVDGHPRIEPLELKVRMAYVD